MIPALLAQIGVPVLAQILSDSLKRLNHPAAQSAADALGALDDALKQGRISPDAVREANRHTEAMAAKKESQLAEINKSLRAEIASQDKYVRRMRPTFGYLMALTWAAQMGGLAYVIIFRTAEAGLVIEAMESLGMIWTIGLSVLGIYVYKRSEEKKHGLTPPPGVLPSRKPPKAAENQYNE